MRPVLLNPVFATLTSLPGVGPKLEKLYARLLDRESPRVADLLFHLPSGVIDRRARPKLNEVHPGEIVTVAVKVEGHRSAPRHRPRAPYQIYTSDETGTLTLTYFNARPDY
jgi:ATP-dependent DNA helicase RecG